MEPGQMEVRPTGASAGSRSASSPNHTPVPQTSSPHPSSQSGTPHPPPTSASVVVKKAVKKRIRKPRGRGLRTKTGCLTCRARHKKCDEQLPVCGHCAISSRECVWPDPASIFQAPGQGESQRRAHSQETTDTERRPRHRSLSSHPPIGLSSSAAASTPGMIIRSTTSSTILSTDVAHARPSQPPQGPLAPTLDYGASKGPLPDSHNIVDPALAALFPETRPRSPIPELLHRPTGAPAGLSASQREVSSQHTTPQSPGAVTLSDLAGNAPLASTKWLDLLAGDAAHADGRFRLAPSAPPHGGMLYRLEADPAGPGRSQASLRVPSNRMGVMGRLDWEIPERYPWQDAADIELHSHEAALLRGFAEKSALWLDLFDPYRHFSTYTIRLAMRNAGLLKAILALQAQYVSIVPSTTAANWQHLVPPGTSWAVPMAGEEAVRAAVQYYQETLNYVSTALQYQSYANSEEILATALILSTYEMLDAHREKRRDDSGSPHPHECNSNWQRHLKGVFWIQRSQDAHGDSGGLRQSVWWAWLRQDLWAAFRERRRCLSVWRPVTDYPDLTQSELADRAIYLLSQAVNYCAESERRHGGGDGRRGTSYFGPRPESGGEELRGSSKAAGKEKRSDRKPNDYNEDGREGDGDPGDDAEGDSASDDSFGDESSVSGSMGGDEGLDAASSFHEFVRRRSEQGEELMEMLERWRSFLGDGFRPLPTASADRLAAGGPQRCWQPIWIHPPQFAVAMQAYSFARILVSLHRPAVDGCGRTQRTLSDAVATICGIAMELVNEASQIMSAQCLFGAGLCVQDEAHQEAILALMEMCERRSGWPTATMRADLRREWRGKDTEMTDAHV